MPPADQAEIAFIVAIFLIFALALAYGSWQQYQLEKDRKRQAARAVQFAPTVANDSLPAAFGGDDRKAVQRS